MSQLSYQWTLVHRPCRTVVGPSRIVSATIRAHGGEDVKMHRVARTICGAVKSMASDSGPRGLRRYYQRRVEQAKPLKRPRGLRDNIILELACHPTQLALVFHHELLTGFSQTKRVCPSGSLIFRGGFRSARTTTRTGLILAERCGSRYQAGRELGTRGYSS